VLLSRDIGSQAHPLIIGIRNIPGFVLRQGRPFQVRLDRHEPVQFRELVEVSAVLGLVKVPNVRPWGHAPFTVRALYNARVGTDEVGAAVVLPSRGDVPNLTVITQVVIRGLPRIVVHLIFVNIFFRTIVFHDQQL